VSREGGSADRASTDLWPQLATEAARQRCWVSLSDIRKAVAQATQGAELLPRFGSRYRFDQGLVRCDLWDLEHALERARAAGGGERDALEDIRRLYRGSLAEDLDALFIETAREQLRRRVADAHLRLAALLERDEQLGTAIAVLERLVEIDPGGAEADERLVDLHRALGQDSSAEQVRERLRGHQSTQARTPGRGAPQPGSRRR
jgi:DNA-binding SARP family transcriptional activator